MSRLAQVIAALIFLAACPAEEPKRDDRPPKRKKARPKPKPAPPPQLEQPEPTPAPEPELILPEKTNLWWCLCYQREGDEGPEPVTACRELEAQCRKLEGRIEKGSKSIIAGSMTHGCRTLRGQHPSDVAGTPEQWKPSKLAGAWVSEGVCQLAVAPAPAPGEEPPPAEPAADPLAFMSSELIGKLAIGSDSATVRFAYGQPQARGAIEEWAAIGMHVQSWAYDDGLTLEMASSTHSGPQSVLSVTIEAPSKLESRRGVGIGDTREAVERAYADVRDPDDAAESSEDSFVAGSVYGGLIFFFEDGVVTRMFLGAAAE